MPNKITSLFKNISNFFKNETLTPLGTLVTSNPQQFMQTLQKLPDWLSLDVAKKLDKIDPLHYTTKRFKVGKLIPFAGHSLGPVFRPVLSKIKAAIKLQKKLHAGHFPDSHPEGKQNGHWFDCDLYQPGLQAAKNILGFADDSEFIFTASGLSQNLGMLMDTFFRPTKRDWAKGKTKIIMLDTEFFSDQALAASVMERAIQTAIGYECFDEKTAPTSASQIIKLSPDERGLFNTQTIIDSIKAHAAETQLICLSDIVFSTGQRLELNKIFTALAEVIKDNKILVGLDLAHTVGNRPIDLKSMPITYAAGCGYKHVCGFPGSGFGFFVSLNADLKKYAPIQGWKAAASDKVFQTINHYDASIMASHGALAFRTSNPPPMSLIPAQAFLAYFDEIGFEKCFNKSECLTQYLYAQLQYQLQDKIEFITPEDPQQRGAMLVFRVKGLGHMDEVEEYLKQHHSTLGKFEIDVRPPNNIRLTPHYGYTTFEQIHHMVTKLGLAIDHSLTKQYEGNYKKLFK